MRTWMLWTSGALVALVFSCATAQDASDLPGGSGGSGGSGGTKSGYGGTGAYGGTGGTSAGGSGGTGGSSGGECASDAECSNSPNGKVCDKWKNVCVGCIPSPDTCPKGQYCDSTQTCKNGCKSTADCGVSGGGTDAGLGGDADADAGGSCASITCETATHTCVGCCSDDNCPLGQLCDTGTRKCIPGCTPQHGCDGALLCCTGQCADVTTDANRCGSCDTKCAIPNATAKCVSSKCDIDKCNTGFDNCNSDVKDGCEQDVSADAKNCGKCGADCSKMANVDTATCAASKCVISKCLAGFGDCDKDGSNGCEADFNSDPANCTACGKACPMPTNGTGLCEGGTCSVKCNAYYGDCDGKVGNGCEASLLSNNNNCGKCGVVCGSQNAAQGRCAGGSCLLICSTGYQDCNKDKSDGCEANPQLDPLNCGSCGHKCPGTAPNCLSGQCKK